MTRLTCWIGTMTVLASLPGGLSPRAWGQEKPQPLEKVMDLSLEDGTVGQLAKLLSAFDEDLNVIVSGGQEMRDYPLPDLKLKQVKLANVLGALETMNVYSNVRGNVIVLMPRGREVGRVEMFPLRPLVEGLSDSPFDPEENPLDSVLSLIKAALELQAQGKAPAPKPVLKLHEATGVLLAKGTDKELETIHRTLETLRPRPDDIRRRMEREMQDAHEQWQRQERVMIDQIRDLDRARDEAAEVIRRKEKQIELMNKEIAELRAMVHSIQQRQDAERAKD